MALPLSTTTVTVLRGRVADQYAEPYSGTSTTALDEIETGVRAVIDIPVARDAGRETVRGGEQTSTEFRFSTDICQLRNSDFLRDEQDGVLYRVTWCFTFHRDHIEGGLKLVEGLV